MLSEAGEAGKEQPEQKNRNSVPIFQRMKLLAKIESALEELLSLPEPEQQTWAEQALAKAVPTFLKKLKDIISKQRE